MILFLLTSATAVGSSEDGTLLYCAKGSEQLSDIVFCLLLAEHSHEQLSVCGSAACRNRENREKIQRNTLVYALGSRWISLIALFRH